MNRRSFLRHGVASVAAGGTLSHALIAAESDQAQVGPTFSGYKGDEVTLSSRDIDHLEKGLVGRVIRPTHPAYDGSRAIWNASIDRRPGLIVQPRSSKDVADIVRFSFENGLSLSVRGGGHNHNGYAVSEGGLMMDLSLLADGHLNRRDKTIAAQAGMTWARFDALTHQAGLATSGAIVSMVGIAGYTLGGGIGWLHRKFGAGCDNLIGAEVVLPCGEIVRADQHENEELLWALRGGGGNFGVATTLRFRLHELQHVLAGLVFFPLDQIHNVGSQLDDYLDAAPDDLNVWMLHRIAPRSPMIAKEHHGKPVLMLAVTWTGDDAEGQRVIAPLLDIVPPIGSSVQRRAYPAWQSALDGAWGNGFCNEWLGGYLDAYDSRVRETIARFVNSSSSPISDVKVARLGGEFSRFGPADAAFGNRDHKYAYVIQARWPQNDHDARHLAWAYEFHEALGALADGGVYVNFIGSKEPAARVLDAYEPVTLARLRAIKAQFDPHNFFNLNANITPAIGRES